MSERLGSKYRNLFRVQILHHYWLDEGATLFDQITEPAQKTNRLLTYDLRKFLTVTPTEETAKTLNGLSCICRTTAQGILVAVQEGTMIPKDAVLEWTITVKTPDFFNYTSLTLRSQKIYTFYHPLEKKVYRYKENVPVLTNLTGVTRGTGSNKTLFLSQEIPALAADDQIEVLILSGNKVKQLVSDQPNAAKLIMSGQAKDLPVFIHQGDIPVITPPVGLDGIPPSRGILLTDAIPDTVFALIRLNAVRADNDIFSFVDNSGFAKTNPTLFQMRFKNRSTIWQYFNKNNGVFKSEEANPLPLTYFGNAGTKQKPSAGLPKAIKDGVRITRLVSEIFE
jgi:hypothetical protein